MLDTGSGAFSASELFDQPIQLPSSAAVAPDLRTERCIGQGALIGFGGAADTDVWLGIPYAIPPVGARRWRGPAAPVPWSGTLHALNFGSPCCQRKFFPDGQGVYLGTEDCLYLNIWAPRCVDADVRLPVMVWIHGGGNVGCHAGTFDGSRLAGSQHVVVVTFNYRIGVMGWFRHAALRDGACPEEDSGNFAILDIMAALTWVKTNIAAFGGNPDQVTVFGESSGATNVYTLLTAPAAAGLFQRAIIQSGSPATMPLHEAENYLDDDLPGNPQSSAEMLLQLLLNEGLAENRQEAMAFSARMGRHEVADYLRKKSFADLDRAYRNITKSLGAFPQLFRDGTVIPADGILAAIERGACHAVPILMGTTRDEFTLLPPFMSSSRFARSQPGSSTVTIPNKPLYYLAIEYLSQCFKAYCVDEPAAALCRVRPDPVFVYRFEWDKLIPLPWADNVSLGATHGLDVPFIFGSLALGPEFFQLPLIAPGCEAEMRALARVMMSYWAQFAATGNPYCGRQGELAQWSAFDARTAPCYRVFTTKELGYTYQSMGTVTKSALLATLAADKRLGDIAARREFLHELIAIVRKFSLLGDEDLEIFECHVAAACEE